MKSLQAFIRQQSRTKSEAGVSNTPLDSQKEPQPLYTPGLDTFHYLLQNVPTESDFGDTITSLEAKLGDEIAQDVKGNTHDGGRKWDEVWVGLKGIRIYRDLATTKTPGRAKVCFGGKVLASVSHTALYAWVKAYGTAYDGKATRLDAYIDDHTKSVSLEQVEEAVRAGQCRGIRSAPRYDDLLRPGKTVGLGSRRSNKYGRIYDKTAESKGKIIGNRWEEEFKRHQANEALKHWMTAMSMSEEKGLKALAGLVLGAVSFVHKKDKNADRDIPLDWWVQFKAAVGAEPIRIKAEKYHWSVQGAITAMNRQYGPTIAGLKVLFGSKFHYVMDLIADEAEGRISAQKLRALLNTPPDEICVC